MTNPLDRLRYHVTGAIERGEGVAIVADETPRQYDCYVPMAPDVPHQLITAMTSFDARRTYAAQHTAMLPSDVVATRVG